MTLSSRRILTVAGAALLGAVAFLVAGPGPAGASAVRPVRVDWRLPGDRVQELEAIDAVWKTRTPWGAPPAPASEPPPPPPSIPVGVIGTGKALRAIFVTAGSPEVRVKAGDKLPDGGKVTRISRFHVSWTDGRGEKHEQELLADPLPKQTATP